jgi:hypothetical protein
MRVCQATRGERLWFANLAAMLVGAELAQAANLHGIDVARIEAWVIDTLLPEQRRAVRDSRPLAGTILGDVLADMQGNTVIVAQSHSPDPKLDPTLVGTYVLRDATLTGPLKVRFEEKNKRAFITKSALRAWCKHRHMSYGDVIEDMRFNDQLVKDNARTVLGRGVPKYGSAAMGMVECIVVQACIEDLPGDEL